MPEVLRSAWCREQGIYPGELDKWWPASGTLDRSDSLKILLKCGIPRLVGSHLASARPDASFFAMQQIAATQHVLANRVRYIIEITGTRFEFQVTRNILILVEDRGCFEFGIRGTDPGKMIGHLCLL
ncbi:MAG: hypothetical protein A3E79_02460 [Burkholderiales bacterium RIFCSPHIGHO2_12_FULL_61_11]|nr:MAG: hypothetical protein A3E79_02460 [Burkholderiales bacterium RIFCSPHIGHO2_12_FULL_61_11]